jgi:hypothetical protein
MTFPGFPPGLGPGPQGVCIRVAAALDSHGSRVLSRWRASRQPSRSRRGSGQGSKGGLTTLWISCQRLLVTVLPDGRMLCLHDGSTVNAENHEVKVELLQSLQALQTVAFLGPALALTLLSQPGISHNMAIGCMTAALGITSLGGLPVYGLQTKRTCNYECVSIRWIPRLFSKP